MHLHAFSVVIAAVGLALPPTQVVARVPTGSGPAEVVAAEGAVWVTNDGSGTLTRVDPRTNRVTATIRIGRGAFAIAAGAGALWVSNYRAGTVSRVDLRTHAVQPTAVGANAGDVLVAAGRVWVTSFDEGTLVAVDPATRRVVRRIEVGGHPTGLLFDRGSIWVGLAREATDVLRVDPRTGSIRRYPVGVEMPRHFAAVPGGIWVASGGDALVRLAPGGRVTRTVRVGRTLGQPALAPDGTLWVPDKEIDTIFRVDPATGKVLDSFPGGNGVFHALAAFGSIWAASYAGTDVWRFRTGR
jgi:YVTN family beta-propeller protein